MFRLIFAAALACCGASANAQATSEKIPLKKPQIQQIEQYIADKMRDPESARFKDIRARKLTRKNGKFLVHVCGQVNGTNAFGGYTGYRAFLIERRPNGREFVAFDDGDWLNTARSICNQF